MSHIPHQFMELLATARRVPMFQQVDHSCSDSELNDAVEKCDAFLANLKAVVTPTGPSVLDNTATMFHLLNTSGHSEVAEEVAKQMAGQLTQIEELRAYVEWVVSHFKTLGWADDAMAQAGAKLLDQVESNHSQPVLSLLTDFVLILGKLPTMVLPKSMEPKDIVQASKEAVDAMVMQDLKLKDALRYATVELGKAQYENMELEKAYKMARDHNAAVGNAVLNIKADNLASIGVAQDLVESCSTQVPFPEHELGRLSPDGRTLSVVDGVVPVVVSSNQDYAHWTPIVRDVKWQIDLQTLLKDKFLDGMMELSHLYYDSVRSNAHAYEFVMQIDQLFEALELDALDLKSPEYQELRRLHRQLRATAEARRVEALSVLLDTGRNAQPQDRTLPPGWVMMRADAYAILRATLARREALDKGKDFDFKESIVMFTEQSIKDTENYFTRQAARGLRNRQTD